MLHNEEGNQKCFLNANNDNFKIPQICRIDLQNDQLEITQEKEKHLCFLTSSNETNYVNV